MRYIVVGTSGAGKSTFAQALASRKGVDYIELDRLFWGPNWTPVPSDQFSDRVAAATETSEWVADGNYSAVRQLLWSRATHIVWLNFDRFTVFSRVLLRTIRRAATREELWAGNRDTMTNAFLSKDSILWWSLTTFSKNRVKFTRLRQGPEFDHLQWHELRSSSQAKDFLRFQQGDI